VRSGAGYGAPAFLLLLAFFILPVLSLLLRSVLEPELGLQNYETLIATSTYVKVFWNTFLVSTVVTVVTLVTGYPIAWFLTVMPRKWSSIVFAVVLLSMWTNLLARTYGWMILLQRTGVINKTLIYLGLIDTPLPLINNLTGVTIGMVYIMLPFVILPLHATMRSLDPATLRAAAVCGAGRWQAFRRVLFPLTLPGLVAGGLMVFVMSLGYFVTPALLGGTSNMMLGELIAVLVQSLLDWGLGGAAAFVLLVVTLSIYAVQIRYFSGRLD
jgi:putative spermidine/putrescine transport system permease protein